MKFLRSLFLAPCRLCFSPFGDGRELCGICEGLLRSRISSRTKVKKEIEGLRVFSLFEWNQSDWLLYEFLHSLKNSKDLSLFLPWARELLLKMDLAGLKKRRPILLVPAPPKVAGQMDHAGSWALALAQLLKADIFWGLQRPFQEGKGQRLKARSERQKLRLGLRGQEALSCQNYKAVWFVDDVVTTGSTAKAAYRALGGVARGRFSVISLAYRPPCGLPKPLL